MQALFFYRFNTSHVTLYRNHGTPGNSKELRFNTSHVTLYLIQDARSFISQQSFQYISCYSLSHKDLIDKQIRHIVSIHLMLLFIPDRWIDFKISLKFQYISCYSLSYFALSIFNSSMGFNTSHVTLYHCYAFSHVPTSVLVSIHLMLLFIFLMELRVLSIFSVSIHLMLLFIRKRVAFYKFFTIVSIHLMLLFI